MENKVTVTIERYSALDGVRVIAMLSILVMHVLANVPFREDLSWLYRYIVKLGEFTSLFMLLSAFSVSCGYYEKISNGGWNSLEHFYKRRFSKILPFFATLTVIDVLLSPSGNSMLEAIANISLAFGYIPDQTISVIGVGWTLGVIFAFYFTYPFFVYCMKSKSRLLILYLISVFYAFIGNTYFGLGKVDLLFCLIYFVTGCVLYVYRDFVKEINRNILFVLTVLGAIAFFMDPGSNKIIKYVFITLFSMYAISVSMKRRSILSNKFLIYFNQFSFEIYLCHMVAYRIVEKISLLNLMNNYLFSYIFLCVCVFTISYVISYMFKRIENLIIKKKRKFG